MSDQIMDGLTNFAHFESTPKFYITNTNALHTNIDI